MNATTRIAILAVLAGAASTSAQNPLWVAPGLSFQGTDPFWDFATNPVLNPLTTHSRPLWAFSAHKLPSDPPGQWTVCLTVRALLGYGNPATSGYSGFVLGKWDPSSATAPLVLTNEANAVNATFVDYNLNLEPITRDASGAWVGGRYAVFDRFNLVSGQTVWVGAFLATRPNDTAPFGAPVMITNLQGIDSFADPALGYVGGRLKLFYGGRWPLPDGDEVQGILMDDLLGVTTATPSLAGNPVLVDAPVTLSTLPLAYCHSPTPVTGPDGDVEGLFVAEGDNSTGVSDIYFAADLDPLTPHVATLPAPLTNWLNSGGVAGGSVMVCSPATPPTVHVGQGAFLLGDEVTLGPSGTVVRAVVRLMAYSPPGQPPATTFLFANLGWLPAPVALPPVFGELAISPTVTLGSGVTSADQWIDYAIPFPSDPRLRGFDLPIQGAASVRVPNGIVNTLTNSATIRLR